VKPLRPEHKSELRAIATPATAGSAPPVAVVPIHPQDAGIRLLVERVRLVAWTTDGNLRITWGLKSPSLSGLESRVARLLESANQQLPAVAAHRRALAGEAAQFDLEWRGRTLNVRVEPLRDAGGVAGTVALALEAERTAPGTDGLATAGTEPDGEEHGTRGEAGTRDDVTGLPGRATFLARLRRCTAPQWCVDGLFVLLLDLHRFKDINDRFGFAAGDRILAEVATRLKGRLRASDTVARFGPDEFAIMLSQVASGQDAARVAERLLAALSPPFDVDGRRIAARASIGIALGVAGARAEDVMREAERALGRAKVLGRSDCRPLTGGVDAEETSVLHVETALRVALDQDEIRSRYRPTVLRKDGKVPSFEVVLWRRPPAEGEPADAGPGTHRTG
jgi:diguanylate cyclase (GGDEF)-like protein